MRKRRTIFCVMLSVALLGTSACGKTEAPSNPTSETQTAFGAAQTILPTDEAAQSAPTSESGLPEEPASETETQTETADPQAEREITDVAEVLALYQWAAARNEKAQYTKTLELLSMDGGEGKVASHVDVFEPIAKKAISKSSITGDVLPGDYKNIRPSDWLSASAVRDGGYTTITVQVVPQTDDAYGREFDGPVGRSMTVLNGMATAIDAMHGVSADFANGQVEIQYQNPRIRVRFDSTTGEFIPGECTWSYRVHPILHSLDAKVLAFKVHLQGANGYIDYTMSY